jgi:hypothetical protein
VCETIPWGARGVLDSRTDARTERTKVRNVSRSIP